MNNNIPTYEILDTLQEQISTINIYRKQGNLISLGNQLTTLLESLDELITRSLVVFLTLDLKNEQEEDNDDYQNEDYKVTPTDMIRANKLVGNILLRVVSGELNIEDGHDDERMDQAAKIIAHLSGRGAIGSHIRTWMIPYIDPNGNIEQFQIKLHEPGYTGNGIGFKTWGAAPLLSKKLIQENLISDIKNRPVLELGTGTGMIGIICEKLGAPEITLTDYHPKVLENAKINVELNECQGCYVTPLDFIEFAKQTSSNNNSDNNEWKDKKYSVVIASDLLYEMDHAEHLPIAVEKLMENDFYFLIPLRDTHWKEVNRFEEKMKEIGLYQRIKQDTILQEDEGVVKYRYYEYSRLASP